MFYAGCGGRICRERNKLLSSKIVADLTYPEGDK